MATHSPDSSRRVAAEKTRETLIEAGLVLAESTGLEGLSVNVVVAAAGVSKGTFFHHFGDRALYLVALHRRFHDSVFDEVTRAVGDTSPGSERLSAFSQAYLDACLKDRGVKALILEARGSLLIQEEVRRRNRSVVEIVAKDFIALGWQHPRQVARLWVALNAEAALVELELGHRDQATRRAINRMTANGT